MQKNPTEAKFIISAPKWLVKPLSKAVTAALKSIYIQVKNYNFKVRYYLGVKTFWPVQRNESAIDTINKLKSRNVAISNSTFDFSTLYTNISHHNLK